MTDPEEIDEVVSKAGRDARRKPRRMSLGRFRRSVETSDEAGSGGSSGEDAPIAEESPDDAAEESILFDAASAHRNFSVEAFNSAWDLIEKSERTDDDVDEMVNLAHASAWHWTKRQDLRPKNRAISAWQLSRVYAEAGRYEESERWARRSLAISEAGEVGPVFTGYAYEALARLAGETGDAEKRDEWLALGRAQAELIDDKQDQQRLRGDLDDLA